jgi:hypothetical protein
MKKFLGAMGVAGVLIFAGGSGAEAVTEGQWTMTITTRIGGMDEEYAAAMEEMENMDPAEKAMMQQMMGGMGMGFGGQGMTTTITQCVSNDDPVPDWETDEDCTSTHTMNGNSVHFQTVCPDGTSTGDVTYQDESMQGVITSHQTVDGEETEMTIEISGEYVGPCPE